MISHLLFQEIQCTINSLYRAEVILEEKRESTMEGGREFVILKGRVKNFKTPREKI